MGVKIEPFLCACKTRHHEYVCYEAAGEIEGAERVIEATLRSLGQYVFRWVSILLQFTFEILTHHFRYCIE